MRLFRKEEPKRKRKIYIPKYKVRQKIWLDVLKMHSFEILSSLEIVDIMQVDKFTEPKYVFRYGGEWHSVSEGKVVLQGNHRQKQSNES